MQEQIKWLETFSVGVQAIDDDHRMLLDYTKDFQTAVAEGDAASRTKAFHAFRNAAAEHFLNEERILDGLNYPGLPRHQESHMAAVEALDQLALDKTVFEDQGRSHELLQTIIAMMIEDIIRQDMRFKSFLEESGAT